MNSEVCERNVDIREEVLVHILDAAASIKKREGRLQHYSLFAQKLQSAFYDGGISNIYFEVQQIYHFCVTNFLLKYKIAVKS